MILESQVVWTVASLSLGLVSLGMAFPLEILKSGIGIANKLTKGVQANVTFEAWTGQDGYGVDSFASPVTLTAVVDMTRKQAHVPSGLDVTVMATLTIVGDVAPNGAAGRVEPIDPRDRITLADGTTGPIVDAPGAVVDPSTNRGLIHVVMLGAL